MSQASEKKRRKLYLSPGQPFVLPRSTAWFKKRSESDSAAGTSLSYASASPGGSNSNRSSNEDEDDDHTTRPIGTDSEPGSEPDESLSEDGSLDEGDDEHSGSGETPHDDPQDDNSGVPEFDETDLFARCTAEFGTRTLPGSNTTVAVGIVLIMSFIVAQGLPWTAVDDLLNLVDALFGFKNSGLPRTKYLLRKLWAPKYASVVNYHYYCNVCASLLKVTADKLHLCCDACQTTLSISKDGECTWKPSLMLKELQQVF
ncbi:uncharacterized protein LOC135390212 [Ornithodoros turicata]|uniref:uncharacterized protein LOC135390212 n=1 Tax=Ornithodoros turicata TaxID=34597 RepID=UPI003139F9FE